jgi:hypothetical protein
MSGRKTPRGSKAVGTDHPINTTVHPIGTPPGGSAPNTGPLASASWLVARELVPAPPKWFVTITFASRDGAKLDLEILSEEWGFRFERQNRVSWIRVTDIAFAHGHDDHQLLGQTPKLVNIGTLVRSLEKSHGIRFDAPIVRTNIDGADRAIATWLQSL